MRIQLLWRTSASNWFGMTNSTKNELSTALRELVDKSSAKTETARLRDVFDEIEAAFQSGVKHAAVLAVLNEKGFKMKMAGFKTALQRIRKERRGDAK